MISVQHSLGTCWMCFVSSSCFHIFKTPTSWHTCWIVLTCWIWTWSGFLQVALDQCFQINAHPFAAYLRCCSQIALVKHGKAPRPNIPSKSLVIQFALCCGWLDCNKKSATKWLQHDKWQYMAIHQLVAMPILPSPSATRRWSSAGFHGSWWICQSCHWFGECASSSIWWWWWRRWGWWGWWWTSEGVHIRYHMISPSSPKYGWWKITSDGESW